MSRSTFDQLPGAHRTSLRDRETAREAAQRSVDRVSHTIQRVFAEAQRSTK
jgi:hypothetical protein